MVPGLKVIGLLPDVSGMEGSWVSMLHWAILAFHLSPLFCVCLILPPMKEAKEMLILGEVALISLFHTEAESSET